MLQYILIYLTCGIVFNFMYDLLINALGEEHEENRFNIPERILTTLVWPIPLVRFIIGIIKHLTQ